MTSFVCKALCAVAFTISTFATAHANERYLSFDIIGGTTSEDIGGFNVLDGASTADSRDNDHFGVALSYGLRDYVTIGGIPLSPELELAWFGSYTTTTTNVDASQTYNTSLETGRLGANIWWPVLQSGNWRAEMGLGAGLLLRDTDVLGQLDAGSDTDLTGYGQLGFRALRPIGDRTQFKVGLNYVRTGETAVDLFEIGTGTPAGVYTVNASSLELRLGFEIKLN